MKLHVNGARERCASVSIARETMAVPTAAPAPTSTFRPMGRYASIC